MGRELQDICFVKKTKTILTSSHQEAYCRSGIEAEACCSMCFRYGFFIVGSRRRFELCH